MPAADIATLLRGFDSASKLAVQRHTYEATEHGYVELPPELIRADGSLDVYPEVLKLFQPTYRQNTPIIRCSGWVGRIPLNDKYAVEVSTRVPVGNLERILSLALGYDDPKILNAHVRNLKVVGERPASLVSILTDQFLAGFEKIKSTGLLKAYIQEARLGASPVGRVRPFESAWRTAKTSRPTAASDAFSRTTDFGPNRVFRLAIERLYVEFVTTTLRNESTRTSQIARALAHLSDVSPASAHEASPSEIARYIDRLPPNHAHYAEMLMLAQLIIHDAGISVRGSGGAVLAPSILIDLAKVYEDYIRRLLSVRLGVTQSIVVKDGNIGGDMGAMVKLFDAVPMGQKNPKVTPDIVVEVDDDIRLVIDAKHKPAPGLPDRDDVNQVVLYGARYDCERVMILHSERPNGRAHVENCGKVGKFTVFNAMIDLAADEIEAEEDTFARAVLGILQ